MNLFIEKMEDSFAIKKRHVSTIIKYLKRICARNKAHDHIQQLLAMRVPNNDCTLMGAPLSDTVAFPEIYHYKISIKGVCYTHDIRELFQILKNYETAKCPYTNTRFTRYQKYLMIRYFYNKKQHPEFENLIMNHITYRDYTACSAKVNALMDDYNRFDIEKVKDTHLFNLLTELIKFDAKDCARSVQYISQAHHHYINGNMRNYRACVYMFLIHMIESADDRSLVALRIQTRIEYSHYMFISDPIEVRRIRLADFLNSMPAPTPTTPTTPHTPPPIRIRSRSSNEGDNEEEPPRQRRRTDSSSSSDDLLMYPVI
jgi:hypothetical protein